MRRGLADGLWGWASALRNVTAAGRLVLDDQGVGCIAGMADGQDMPDSSSCHGACAAAHATVQQLTQQLACMLITTVSHCKHSTGQHVTSTRRAAHGAQRMPPLWLLFFPSKCKSRLLLNHTPIPCHPPFAGADHRNDQGQPLLQAPSRLQAREKVPQAAHPT